MRSSSPRELPRPEDRRRGDLERWLGSTAGQPCWRSEAFAEDLPAAASVPAAEPVLGALAVLRLTAWVWGLAAPVPVHPH